MQKPRRRSAMSHRQARFSLSAHPNAFGCHALPAEVRQLLAGALLDLDVAAVCRVDVDGCKRRCYEEGNPACLRTPLCRLLGT